MVCFFFKFESKTGFEGVRLDLGCFFTNFYVHGCDFHFSFPVWFCSVVGVVLFFCCDIFVCFFFKFESKTGFEGVRLCLGRFFSNFYLHVCDFRFCFPVWFCSIVGVVLFFCLMSLCSVWFQFVCVLVFFAVFFLWCFVY